MTWWEDRWAEAQAAAGDIADFATGGNGLGFDDVQAYVNPIPRFTGALAQSGAQGLDEAGVTTGASQFVTEAPQVAMKPLEVPGRYTRRAITTAMLLGLDPYDSADSLNPGGNPLVNAWNASEYVSPGQEIVAGWNNYIDDGEQSDPQQARNAVNDAIKNRDKLEKFENNGWGNFVSGTSDASFNWFADPLVVATKGVTVANAVNKGRDVAAEAAQVASKSGGLWERMKWIAQEDTDAAKVSEWLGGTNPQLSGALAQARTPEQASVMWMAARGDQAAIAQLRTEQAAVAAQIEASQNALGFGRVGGHPVGPWSDNLQAELDDLAKTDQRLKSALMERGSQVFTGDRSRMGTRAAVQDATTVVSRSASKEARKIANDDAKYANRWGLQAERIIGRNGRVVNVWKPSAERPSGYYNIAGASVDDGARELSAQLNNRFVTGALPAELRVGLYNEYATATTQVDRLAVLEKTEKTIFKGIVRKSGLSKEAAEAIYKKWSDEKGKAFARLHRDTDGAKWVDESGEVHVNRLMSSQSEDLFVMPDFAAISKEFSNEVRERAKAMGRTGAGTEDLFWDVKNGGTKAFDSFYAIWRPAVLFRLGYPVRNTSEGFLSAAAVIGPLAATRSLKQGLPNWAKNRANGRLARTFNGEKLNRAQADALDEYDSLLARGHELDDELLAASTDAERALISDEAAMLRSRLLRVEDFVATGKYRIGTGTRVFEGVEYPRVFSGTAGRGTRAATSDASSQFMSVTGPGSVGTARSEAVVDRWTLIEPDKADFPRALAEVTNKQFRNSEIGKRLLAGESKDTITAWLRGNSDAAIFERERLGITRAEAASQVDTHSGVILSYLPDPQLRALAAERELTQAEIVASMESSGLVRVGPKQIKAAQRLLGSKSFAAKREELGQKVDDLNAQIAQGPDNVDELTALRDKAAAQYEDMARRQDEAERIAGAPMSGNQSRSGKANLTEDDRTPGPGVTGGDGGFHARTVAPDGSTVVSLRDGENMARWQPIHGRELEQIASNNKAALGGRAARFRNRVYHYIGSLPTDTLLKHPFVEAKYDQYFQAGIKRMRDESGVVSAEDIALLERQATRYATRELKRTLYTIERYSSLSASVRFLSPFFAAFENTATRWGRFIKNDPSLAVHGSMLFTAPIRGGMVTNADGERVEYTGQLLPSKDDYFTFQVNQKIADRIPGLREHSQVRFSVKSLNTVLQGEQWWSPGAGPIVQIPISEIVKHNSEDAWATTLSEAVLTNGPSESFLSLDMALPATAKRIKTLMQGENSREFTSAAVLILKQKNAEWEQGGKQGPPPTLEDALADTRKFYLLRLVASGTLPVAPTFDLKPETQFAVNELRRMQREQRDGSLIDGLTAEERFRRDYPDWVLMMGSASANKTSINPSLGAERNRARYADLIAEVVDTKGFSEDDASILGLIVNDPTDTGFNDQAYTAQQGTAVTPGVDWAWRSTRDVKSAAEQPYIDKGWADYTAMSDLLEASATSAGTTVDKVPELMALKKAWLAKQSVENAAWWSVYSDRNADKFKPRVAALEKALADPKFAADHANDPTWQTVGKYLEGRNGFSAILAARDAAGGSAEMTAQSNADIAALYVVWSQKLKSDAPGFAPVFDRYFDGEFGRVEDYQVGVGF